MATVILLNPFGTDCTNFVNGTFLVPQLLKGTVMSPGDTLYTVPYKNTSGIANVEAAATMLDTKIRSVVAAGGLAKVFSYSEGGQPADLWITENASSPPCGGDQLEFLSIANANSKYGGFVYNHSAFSQVAYTGGLPATVPWPYTMFARQYDGVADFPYDASIQNALVTTQTYMNKVTMASMASAVSSWGPLLSNTAHRVAAENAFWGAIYIHNNYFNVTPDDPHNMSFTDTSGVKYVWSPTYPVPLLGMGMTIPAIDKADRVMIETMFNRPCGPLPMPGQDPK